VSERIGALPPPPRNRVPPGELLAMELPALRERIIAAAREQAAE
jgi:hypothetical protein